MLNNVDADPVVILGCTQREIILLLVIGAGVGIFPATVLAWLMGGIIFALPNLILWILGWMAVTTRWLALVKHGRPHGWYQLRVHVALARVFGSPLLLRSGRWSIGK